MKYKVHQAGNPLTMQLYACITVISLLTWARDEPIKCYKHVWLCCCKCVHTIVLSHHCITNFMRAHGKMVICVCACRDCKAARGVPGYLRMPSRVSLIPLRRACITFWSTGLNYGQMSLRPPERLQILRASFLWRKLATLR